MESKYSNLRYFQDIIRARFYNEFGSGEVVNLHEPGKLASQIFIDKYNSLAEKGDIQKDQLWESTIQVW